MGTGSNPCNTKPSSAERTGAAAKRRRRTKVSRGQPPARAQGRSRVSCRNIPHLVVQVASVPKAAGVTRFGKAGVLLPCPRRAQR